MSNFGMLIVVLCLAYSGLPTQATEDNNDLLDYGDYLDSNSGSGMDEINGTCTNLKLTKIPIEDHCNKKKGTLLYSIEKK